MAIPRIGSTGVGLPFPLQNNISADNARSLAPGTKYIIPAGQYYLQLDSVSVYQVLDPVSGLWVNQGLPLAGDLITSDGVNHRICNLSGCAVGALVTTAGTGYLTAPTVTPSIGGSTWKAILGGSLSSTVTVSTAGSGYNHPPQVLLPPPPAGGVQATATATVSGGAITAITMVNVGAGYLAAPSSGNTGLYYGKIPNTYTIVPDAADTVTTPAVLTFGLNTSTATNVTAIVCTDNGTAVTSVPTLTISAAPSGGTTAVATAIPFFTVTGITVTNVGSNYGGTQPFKIDAPGAIVSGTSAVTNPSIDKGLFQPYPFFGYGTTTSTGTLSATNFVVSFGGIHQAVPTLFVTAGGTTVPTVYGTATAQVGGTVSTIALIGI